MPEFATDEQRQKIKAVVLNSFQIGYGLFDMDSQSLNTFVENMSIVTST